MLSLVGSIQSDPLSPEHVPDHSIISTTISSSKHQRAAEPEAEDVPMADEEVGDHAEESEEEDTFAKLGRLHDEAVAKAEAEKHKEKKRKRKEDKAKGAETAEKDGEGEQKKKKKKKTA